MEAESSASGSKRIRDDEETPVDWTGGRPWDQALRAAVRPLGLRVVIGWMRVSIVHA